MAKSKLQKLQEEATGLGINTESLTTEAALQKAIDAKKAETDTPATDPKQVDLDDAIAEAEATLKTLKGEKQKQELEAKRAAKAEADKNDKRPKYKADNGLMYRFKKDAPKTLNIDGAPQKLDDIIKNKAVMAELVSGNSNFLELVN